MRWLTSFTASTVAGVSPSCWGPAVSCRDSEVGIVRQLGCLAGWQCSVPFLPGGAGLQAMGRAAVRNECLVSSASLFLWVSRMEMSLGANT